MVIRPNKKISVFRVTGLKILGRVGTHIILIVFFVCLFLLGGKYDLCILKGISPFKMHEYVFRKPGKILSFTSKFRFRLGYPRHRYMFLLA